MTLRTGWTWRARRCWVMHAGAFTAILHRGARSVAVEVRSREGWRWEQAWEAPGASAPHEPARYQVAIVGPICGHRAALVEEYVLRASLVDAAEKLEAAMARRNRHWRAECDQPPPWRRTNADEIADFLEARRQLRAGLESLAPVPAAALVPSPLASRPTAEASHAA